VNHGNALLASGIRASIQRERVRIGTLTPLGRSAGERQIGGN
jgi:hypothetical protein